MASIVYFGASRLPTEHPLSVSGNEVLETWTSMLCGGNRYTLTLNGSNFQALQADKCDSPTSPFRGASPFSVKVVACIYHERFPLMATTGTIFASLHLSVPSPYNS